MFLSDKRILGFYESHAKAKQCRDILMVGIQSERPVTQLLGNHIAMRSLTVIASFDPEGKLQPGERLRQNAARQRLVKQAASYPKFKRLIVADPLAGLESLKDAAPYDLVILGPAVKEHNLADVGAAVLPYVKTGGWILGGDHRIPEVRGILDSAVGRERWRAHPREGLWLIHVKRDQVSLVDAPSAGRGNAEDVAEAEAHAAEGGAENHEFQHVDSPEVNEAAPIPRRGRPRKVAST